MIRTKDTVDHRLMTPQIVLAIIRADQLNLEKETWITSISDGAATRVPGSKHLTGNAVDLSIKDIHNPKLWVDRIKRALGPQYDVLLHDSGEGMHIHIEFDPKN